MISFIKNNILTICCVAVIVLLGTIGDVAAANDIMGSAESKLKNTFASVKKIIFVLGGFGLVVLAFAAIFGKLDWKKFAMLATGLAILAAAGAVVDYATGTSTHGGTGGAMADSFGNNISSD